ncbi:MAG: acyltransferase [Chroococcidiopsidaceae cyanobacterium CP_BM_ER_R8_30]|nr:acyltransferase [Chroococcidiopsidaceae cyanobacterium CP_BM_ER_R8_30]
MNRHLPSLDGIRAVSILLVFAAHAGLEKFVPGGFGVTIFFFLSGYLIATLLRIEFNKTRTVSFKRFYLRRALRILPTFYLVLGIAVLLTQFHIFPGELHWPGTISLFLSFSNYWRIFEDASGQPLGTGVYWSLAVEEHFYLVFPWLYLMLQRQLAAPRQQALVLWAICAVVLVWRCILVYGFHTLEDRTYYASDTRADSIVFGCALAVYGNPALDGKGQVSEQVWKCLLLPLGFAGLLFSLMFRDPLFRETFRYSLQGISLYPVFIVALRYPYWGLFRILNLKWVSFLGVLSYSLYLLHYIVIYIIKSQLPIVHPIGQAILAFGLSVLLAWGIYRLVEKPCAKLRKQLSNTEIGSMPGLVGTSRLRR